MKTAMNDLMALIQQGESKLIQNWIRDDVTIRSPCTENDYPGLISPGIVKKNHADNDRKGTGVDDMFSEHDEKNTSDTRNPS
jgi:hypothetical protein